MVHPLPVFFGSGGGTAQAVAEYVATLAGRWGFDAAAVSLDSVPISRVMESSITVFVISTRGDGDMPRNATKFWKFLSKRGLPSDCLKNMRFALFGLGDTRYRKYNFAGRRLHKRLLELGAIELVKRGLANAMSSRGTWGDLDPWVNSLEARLLQLRALLPGTVVDGPPRLEPALFNMTPVAASYNSADEISQGRKEFWGAMAPPEYTGRGGPPQQARLLVNRRLTAEGHFQDVRHLEFDVDGIPGGADYGPGDVLYVHPSNDAKVVERLAARMGLDLDQVVQIRPSAGDGDSLVQSLSSAFMPPVSTIRLLLTEVLDITGTPTRSFFARLSLFAGDAGEKAKLEKLASSAGADLLHEYVTEEKRSYVDVLRDFPSCKVPQERLLEIVPRLRPRAFSIASSSLETPSKVHICMAVVSFRTPKNELRTGVGTSWLASLTAGEAQVPLSIRRGTFKLPRSPYDKIIMVGPGTGIAPMRSVILERRRQRADIGADGGEDMSGRSFAEAARTSRDILFFGCRFREKDFLYEDEWASLSASGEFAVETAFSRSDPDGTGSRVYVQHRIREHADVIAALLVQQGANILVSGSARQMPQDVREAFRDVLAGHPKVGSKAGAEKFLNTMDRQGRYVVEAWD